MQKSNRENSLIEQVTERLELLPLSLQYQVLDFVEFLLSRWQNKEQLDAEKIQKQEKHDEIELGTLTGLRGILKGTIHEYDDQTLHDDYLSYLLEKYQ